MSQSKRIKVQNSDKGYYSGKVQSSDLSANFDTENSDDDLSNEDELSNYSDDFEEESSEDADEIEYEEEGTPKKRSRATKTKTQAPYLDFGDVFSDESDDDGHSFQDLQKLLRKSVKGMSADTAGDAWVEEDDEKNLSHFRRELLVATRYFRDGEKDRSSSEDEDRAIELEDYEFEGTEAESNPYATSMMKSAAVDDRKQIKKKRKRYGKRLTPKIDILLGKANKAIMTDQKKEAMKLLREVVMVAPHAVDAYRSLAAVAGSRGEMQLELELNMCICGINKQDVHQIKETLILAQQCNDMDKQVECLRLLNCAVPDEINFVVDRANLLLHCNKPLMAASTYRAAIKRTPKKVELYFTMSEMCEQSKLPQLENMRIQVLVGVLSMLLGRKYIKASVLALAAGWHVSVTDEEGRKSPGSVFTAARYLSDLLMMPRKPYASVAADVLTGVNEWSKDFEEDILLGNPSSKSKRKLAAVPLDLLTKQGICLVHIDKIDAAMSCFRLLLRQDPSQEMAGSLMAEVAEILMKKRHYNEAIPILVKLSNSESPRKWTSYVKMGEAFTKIGQYESAKMILKEVLELYPGHCQALIAFAALHKATMSEVIAEAALGALRGPIMRIVNNELNIGEKCPEYSDVPPEDENTQMPSDKGIKMLIVDGPWQKLKFLMEYAQLASSAGNNKDQLSILIPVLDHSLRQIRSAPKILKLSKWRKSKVRNMRAQMADAANLPAFYINCSWQTDDQESSGRAVDRIAAEVDLQQQMGPQIICNLIKEVVRGLVSLKRRKDAAAIVRAVKRVSGVPITPKFSEQLNIICAYGVRVLGWKKSSKKITNKIKEANSTEEEKNGSNSEEESETEDILEWKKSYEMTERSSQMEQYLNKVSAIKKDPTNTALWNSITEDIVKQKSSVRRRLDALIEMFPNAAMPWIVQGNTMNASARLKQTLHCFSTAIVKDPNLSLPYLSLGMCLIRLVLNSKRTADFHECAVKAVAALHRYAELRLIEDVEEREARTENDPPILGCLKREVSYNLARAYHQIGLMHMAENLYWNAIKLDEPSNGTSPGAVAIIRVAAYNLSKLYQDTGSIDMARYVLNEYLAIG